MQARIKGSLKVFFYDTEAGATQVEQVFARPRALSKSPYTLEVQLSIAECMLCTKTACHSMLLSLRHCKWSASWLACPSGLDE